MKNLAFSRLFGRKLSAFDFKTVKLVSNPSADDVTVLIMTEAMKREK